jgi:hypothetical protein
MLFDVVDGSFEHLAGRNRRFCLLTRSTAAKLCICRANSICLSSTDLNGYTHSLNGHMGSRFPLVKHGLKSYDSLSSTASQADEEMIDELDDFRRGGQHQNSSLSSISSISQGHGHSSFYLPRSGSSLSSITESVVYRSASLPKLKQSLPADHGGLPRPAHLNQPASAAQLFSMRQSAEKSFAAEAITNEVYDILSQFSLLGGSLSIHRSTGAAPSTSPLPALQSKPSFQASLKLPTAADESLYHNRAALSKAMHDSIQSRIKELREDPKQLEEFKKQVAMISPKGRHSASAAYKRFTKVNVEKAKHSKEEREKSLRETKMKSDERMRHVQQNKKRIDDNVMTRQVMIERQQHERDPRLVLQRRQNGLENIHRSMAWTSICTFVAVSVRIGRIVDGIHKVNEEIRRLTIPAVRIQRWWRSVRRLRLIHRYQSAFFILKKRMWLVRMGLICRRKGRAVTALRDALRKYRESAKFRIVVVEFIRSVKRAQRIARRFLQSFWSQSTLLQLQWMHLEERMIGDEDRERTTELEQVRRKLDGFRKMPKHLVPKDVQQTISELERRYLVLRCREPTRISKEKREHRLRMYVRHQRKLYAKSKEQWHVDKEAVDSAHRRQEAAESARRAIGLPTVPVAPPVYPPKPWKRVLMSQDVLRNTILECRIEMHSEMQQQATKFAFSDNPA